MERVRGIPSDDIEALDAAGIDRKALAAKGVRVFYTQVFRDNFFHADAHAGHIWVDGDPARKAHPRFIALAFGTMGQLSSEDQDRKSTRLNSSHQCATRLPSSPCKKKTTYHITKDLCHENKASDTLNPETVDISRASTGSNEYVGVATHKQMIRSMHTKIYDEVR